MASLLNADPALREYILKHSLPQIFQALLTGLCVSCPESPLHFLERKIVSIQENRDTAEIDWHTCVDDPEQVAVTSLAGSMVHDIFGKRDDTLFLSHLFEKAYSCYRISLTNMCFKAWKMFIWNKRKEARELTLKMETAERHYIQRGLRVALCKWVEWVQVCKRRQNDAMKKIQRVWNAIHCKIVIGAWRYVVQDSKRTKEYFERLENGLLEMSSKDSDVAIGEGHDGLSLLPCKLSIKVFQSLDVGDLLKCAEVCRTWKAITQTCSLWSRISFSVERDWITDRIVEQILQKYRPFVVHLNMRGCTSLQWPSFKCISECRNLQELNLSECFNIKDEMVCMILEGCPTLLYLNLSFSYVANGTLRELSRSCLNLQFLSLACCRRFTDKGLQYLASGKGCHKLIHLDLSGCTQISVEGFRYIAAGCPQLQQIVFNDLPTLSDSCVLELASKCHSLSAISLWDTPHLSDSAFKAIAEVANLTKFSVDGNSRMSDISWRALCRSSPGLTRLHAADCPRMTDSSLKSMGTLKNLVYLNISHCSRVSDMGLRYLTEGPSASKLRELNLSNCSRINDLAIMRVAQKCSKLNHLSVSYCDNLSNSGLEWLSSCSSLLSLDISGCNIMDQGLIALGGNPGLKKLVASECLWITDIGIEKFCRQARGLEYMDVSHCVALSDQAIKALSFYCRTIVTLRMPGCPKMTDLAVQYLTVGRHFLRELDVSGCVLLTDRTPRFLQTGCPQLNTINMVYCRGISKQAALRLQPCVEKWEHSNDDAPYWFGYDSLGQLLQPIGRPDKIQDTWEEEEPTPRNNKKRNLIKACGEDYEYTA
ncbi:dynein regulatory complex subunit 6 isoform X2 [Salvelinus fontinalis]|uniref:dynein regulatory complex subunit 6 isoform X2 n=1 Tax=Salvelinus fontinalis TaxID=8038 RepID=UPI002485903F|nr:dynein regulatory complex subunit 6 isoform X2 [Salvelinus fontinalis]